MNLKRVFLLLIMTAFAARAMAALSANANIVPGGAVNGQLVTITLQISNDSSNQVTSVTPQLVVSSGSAALVSGPSPASTTLAPLTGTANFIYSYSITGCGNLQFTGSASGMDNSTPVTSNQASTIQFGTCPSPTITPTPAPIVIGPTEVPGTADAKVLGNKLHIGSGATVGFKVTVPFGGSIHINIYNRQGQKVKSLDFEGVPGDNLASWDGRGEQGAFVGAGIYAVLFQGKALNKVAKIVVIK